jgi:putative peptide zinc metalloprotease protein
MSESLYSPQWYRVQELKPTLREHARIHRHRYRRERWYVLTDSVTGRSHRFTPAAHYVIASMDGRRSVGEIWDAAVTHLGDAAPTQSETIRLLSELHAADLLRCDVRPDVLELFRRFRNHADAGRWARLLNPLSVRVPLFDPDALLERAAPLARRLFTPAGFCVWFVAMAGASLLAAVRWRELASADLAVVLEPHNLLLLALAYPVVKAAHELGHGLAAKVWGGAVHEIGLMFLVFVPVPYVDASSASSFRSKHRRMIVGAAGIMVELSLAAVALLVWLTVEPGITRSLAFDVMMIGGVSTVFFNGNPLLRFDGYYVLADWIEIPNLSARSTEQLTYLFNTYVLGLPERRTRHNADGEIPWLVVYGICASVYRLFIGLAIALFVASRFFALGVVIAIASLARQTVVPLVRGAAKLRHDPRVSERPGRVVLATVGLTASLLLGLFVLPVPVWTSTQGVVWLPEQAQVRAGSDGFVLKVLKAPGAAVERGEPLIETFDPENATRLQVLEAEIRELRAHLQNVRLDDQVEAEIVEEELAARQAELVRVRAQAAAAVIRSPAAGRVVLPQARDLPGHFVRRGEVLGYVANSEQPIVRAVLSQADVTFVHGRIESVAVRLANRLGDVLPATVQREVPRASERLPSRALGVMGGGPFAVDSRDSEGMTAAEKLFQLDLALPADARIAGIGERAYVRFEHGNEPLAIRGFRAVRRLFLARLGV